MKVKVKDLKLKNSNENGITLITLVITIIILLILAGITINLTLGENGLFNKAKQAKEQYGETSAKEKLDIALLDAQTEKQTNEEYNNGEFLNNMLEEKNMYVEDNTVIVDNYVFTIDRESLIVLESLGKTQIKVSKEVTSYLGKNENGKYEAQILLIVESNTKLEKVVIENPDGTTFEMQKEEINLGKDTIVELDEEYKVIITTKDGKEEVRKIVEKSEEQIGTADALSKFRDKVNSGLTYEGKTIKLENDIDLSSVCGANVNGEEISWEPIGNTETPFKGTFDGNYHTIDHLYINTDKLNPGLFGYNYGIIENVKVSGSVISTNDAAGISAINSESIINCINNVDVTVTVAGNVGGISMFAYEDSIIDGCINMGIIKSAGTTAGGIVGRIQSNHSNTTTITNSYNLGNIESTREVGGIVGFINLNTNKITVNIQNCYNIGTVTANTYKGGIVGNYANTTSSIFNISNNYWISTCGASYGISRANINTGCTKFSGALDYTTLEDAYTGDIQNSDGTWKYNNGYPILKWQIEN